MDDVIVVGAGPAGNNAALGLASKGFAVTVIDSRTNIGEKLCTGIVGQECTRRFPIDPALVYREASSINVVAPSTGHVRFEATTPRARIVDRVAYVASFARQAQAAGATYLLGQRVLQVTPEADGVTVLTDSGCLQGSGAGTSYRIWLSADPSAWPGNGVRLCRRGPSASVYQWSL